MDNQLCKKCGEIKPLTQFNETSMGAVIERITTCKSCQSLYNAEHYRKNKLLKKNLESLEKIHIPGSTI